MQKSDNSSVTTYAKPSPSTDLSSFATLLSQKKTIDQLFKFNKLFFDLPNHVKAKAAHSENPNPHRGWSAVGQESVWQISKFKQGQMQNERYQECRESFDQEAADDKLFLNRWVDEDDLPGFRQFMEGVYGEFHALHVHLLRTITAGLGLSEERLISKHQSNTSELPLLHYPSIPCSSMVSVQRIGEHSDFSSLTLLLQDSVGGLQVEDQQELNRFIPVESEDVYEVVVNVGDCLQRWTNKSLRSANHRVSLPEGKDAGTDEMLAPRYSVAYFGKPDREVLVDTLPDFVRSGTKSEYNDGLTAFEYNQLKLVRRYG